MPRRNGADGHHHSTSQKGRPRRGSGIGSYKRKNKAAKAERYDRPYLTGSYGRGE